MDRFSQESNFRYCEREAHASAASQRRMVPVGGRSMLDAEGLEESGTMPDGAPRSSGRCPGGTSSATRHHGPLPTPPRQTGLLACIRSNGSSVPEALRFS
jgi:hypothetical protein